jgi:hypothetical protein
VGVRGNVELENTLIKKVLKPDDRAGISMVILRFYGDFSW